MFHIATLINTLPDICKGKHFVWKVSSIFISQTRRIFFNNLTKLIKDTLPFRIRKFPSGKFNLKRLQKLRINSPHHTHFIQKNLSSDHSIYHFKECWPENHLRHLDTIKCYLVLCGRIMPGTATVVPIRHCPMADHICCIVHNVCIWHFVLKKTLVNKTLERLP